MSKKRTKTTVIKEEEELKLDDNPISKLIKKFFDTGDIDPELIDLQFEIRVMRFDRSVGKYVTLYGTHYDDLQGMIETLGQRYGTQRYKFYVKAKNAEGKMVAGAIVEHDLFWDSEEVPGDTVEDDDTDQRVEPQQNIFITMLQSQIAQQNQLIIEMIKNTRPSSNGNGVKSSEIFEAIQAGIELASGKVTDGGGEDGSSDYISKLINSPLAGILAQKLLEAKPAVSAARTVLPPETSLPPPQ
jgi:hypothetical protein